MLYCTHQYESLKSTQKDEEKKKKKFAWKSRAEVLLDLFLSPFKSFPRNLIYPWKKVEIPSSFSFSLLQFPKLPRKKKKYDSSSAIPVIDSQRSRRLIFRGAVRSGKYLRAHARKKLSDDWHIDLLDREVECVLFCGLWHTHTQSFLPPLCSD